MFTYHESGSRQWLALVSDRRILVIDRSAADDVRRVWRAVSRKRLGDVLFALTGSDVLSAPPFALADWAGDLEAGATVRVFVRGPLAVRVTAPSEPTSLRGDGMLTWHERVVEQATEVTVVTPEAELGSQEDLPLQAGVCWASSVSAQAVEAATSTFEQVVPARSEVLEPVLASSGEAEASTTDAAASVSRTRRARRSRGESAPWASSPRFTFSVSGAAPEPLDSVVVLGRMPAASSAIGTDEPRLISVEAPQHDVSRSHVQFCAEGDDIIVTDLGSRNGTRVVEATGAPRTIDTGEPTVVPPGSVVTLGESVSILFERA